MADAGASVVGIEVSSTALRIVEVVSVGGKAALRHAFLLDLADPRIADLMGNAMGSLKRDARKILVINSSKLILKRLRISRLPLNELPGAIQWEMKEFLPFSLEEAMLDYEILGEAEELGVQKYDVSVACAAKEVIYTPFNLLVSYGVFPDRVTTPICALERLASALPRQSESPSASCLLYLGDEDTQILILPSAGPVFWRQILIGMKKSTLMTPGGSAQGGVPEDPFRRDFLAYLLPEIRRTTDHYFEESQGVAIEDVTLFGGGGQRLETIAASLAEQLSLPVKVGNPFLGFGVLPEFPYDPATPSSQWQELVLATGAALSDDSKINLLPQEIKRASANLVRRLAVIVGVTAAIIIEGFLLSWLKVRVQDLNTRLAPLQIELNAATPQLTELDTLESLRQRVLSQTAALDYLNAQRMPLDEALKEISNLIPREMILTDLRVEEGRLSLKGEIHSVKSSAEVTLSNFIKALGKGMFRDVNLGHALREDPLQPLSTFELDCAFDEPPASLP